jgi:hypothetical protein
MRGLLADVNVQGHLPYLRQRLEALDLWGLLDAMELELITFRALGLDTRMNDRSLWTFFFNRRAGRCLRRIAARTRRIPWKPLSEVCGKWAAFRS